MKMSKAKKYDQAKPKYHVVPTYALEEVMKAFTYGADKYGAFNYSGGMEYSRYINAAIRHINDFLQGENIDESGNTHLSHAVASLMMLMDNMAIRAGTDDRNPKYLEYEAK